MAKQSLFDQLEADRPSCTMRRLKLEQIIRPEIPPPPEDDYHFRWLCGNVKTNGVVVPIQVRPYKDKFYIVEGIRRYYAALAAGQTAINTVVLEFGVVTKADVLTLTLNSIRSSNLLAEAAAIQRVKEQFAKRGYDDEGLVYQAISRLTGLESGAIARRERLLMLDTDLQAVFQEGRMSTSVAEAASKLSPARQKALVKTYAARREGDAEARISASDLHEERTVRRQEALDGLPDDIFETPERENGYDDTDSKTWRAFALLAELGYEWREGQWLLREELSPDAPPISAPAEIAAVEKPRPRRPRLVVKSQ